MSAKRWPDKSPAQKAFYGFNWSPRLPEGDTIVEATGVKVSGDVIVGSTTVAPVPGARESQGAQTWLSGGTLGTESVILLYIKTANGVELDQRMTIEVKER